MRDELSPWNSPGVALAAQARDRPHAPALAFPGADVRMSFAEWNRGSRSLARGLFGLGLGPGDRIAIIAENRIEWPLAQLAVALMGGVLVPLNTHNRQEDLGYALAQSGCRAVLLSPRFRSNDYLGMLRTLDGHLPDIEHVIVFDETAGNDCVALADVVAAGASTATPLPDVSPDDIGYLLYTSGTSGFPKGALLSHRAALGNAWGTIARLAVRGNDRWTSIIPLFHCAGCIMNMLGCLQSGACYVGVPAFDPVTMFEVIERERCTVLSGVPTSYIAMLEHPRRGDFDLGSLRAGTCGGSDADPEMLRRCAEAFPVPGLVQVYGQTESATLVSCPQWNDEGRFETAGPPLPGVELRIADPDTGTPLPTGRIGEIEVRGRMNMAGYYDRPEDTAGAFREGGWLKTGDLGRVDRQGRLVIAGGRLKDMIIRGGENVYPAEIEIILARHPAVETAAVFGIPDRYYGEIVAAAVRLRGATGAGELAEFCAERIADFKVPARFYRVAGFPLTAIGKLRRVALRKLAEAGRLEALP